MRVGIETVCSTDLDLQSLDAWANELDDATARSTNQMVVAQPHVHVLEEMPAAAQVVFANQTTFDQELERPVHRGAGSLEAVGLHGLQELLCVDMTVLLVDLVKKSQALCCQP